MISERTLKTLFELNKEFWARVSKDSNVPQSVKSMIYQHLQILWIPNALAVVLSPIQGGSNPMLTQPVFNLEGNQFYYPSLDFWKAHAQVSHPPNGEGCNPEIHSEFLTAKGAKGEFIYAVVLRDGSIKIQDLDGFIDECAFYEAGQSG